MIKPNLPRNPCRIHGKAGKTINTFLPCWIHKQKFWWLEQWGLPYYLRRYKRSPSISALNKGLLWALCCSQAVREIHLLNGGLFRPVMCFWLRIWSNITVPGVCFPWEILTWENETDFASPGEAVELWNVTRGEITTKIFCITWVFSLSFDFLLLCILFLVGWTEKVAECLFWLMMVY